MGRLVLHSCGARGTTEEVCFSRLFPPGYWRFGVAISRLRKLGSPDEIQEIQDSSLRGFGSLTAGFCGSGSAGFRVGVASDDFF